MVVEYCCKMMCLVICMFFIFLLWSGCDLIWNLISIRDLVTSGRASTAFLLFCMVFVI